MDPFLDLPKEPNFLKQLGLKELEDLAAKIRQRILSVLSVTGGHLASNLGTVELTLALHTVFDSPIDKFIFDVSHQTYTHKLLTGRDDEKFNKIRQSNGLCGFAHPKESPHDHFYAGHAGTALSLALGVAKERDLRGGSEHIIPIIGDAALTCGLSLEALNNMKKDLKQFVVILNDNAMSISENVGGITNILSRLLSNPRTSKWVHGLENLLAKIPVYGNSLAKKGWKFAESIKNLVSNAPFFEQFGLSYIGPIDGHDLNKLVPVLNAVKDLPMPVIIHTITKKGNGVKQAENDPITYHGVKPFDPATCEFLPSPTKNPTFPKVFGKHLLSLANQNPNLITVTPAMSLGSCLDPFMKKYPERCIDVGIAEGHAVTFCGGLAKSGKSRVICSIYATFLQRALDNLFHDVCLQELPVIFAIDRAGIAFGDGSTHHGIYDISFLRAMPNMIICQPRNGQLLKELLSASLTWNAPAAIRYPNIETEDSLLPLEDRPIGKGEWLARGDDVLIISLGHLYKQAFEVKKLLLEKGISAAIIDPIFIKPLDKELLSLALMNFQKVVTLEEHSLKGGLGAEINEFILSYGFTSVQVLNIGVPDLFVEHGNQSALLDQLGLSAPKITQKILSYFSFQLKMVSGASK